MPPAEAARVILRHPPEDLRDTLNTVISRLDLGLRSRRLACLHLDRVTQQNAALVEQSAAAAESLKQQAARLVGAVAAFRIAWLPELMT